MKTLPNDVANGQGNSGGTLRWANRIMGGIALTFMLACGDSVSDMGCEHSSSGGGGAPPGIKGIYFGNPAATETLAEQTYGEAYDVPITVKTLAANEAGQACTVSVEPLYGYTFALSDAHPTLPATIGDTTQVSLHVVIKSGAQAGRVAFQISRTGGQGVAIEQRQYVSTFDLVDDLVTVTVTPQTQDIPQGQGKTYTLGILPRGDTEGPVDLDTEHDNQKVSVVPSSFQVNLVRGSTTPVTQVITVNAGSLATGTNERLDIQRLGHRVGSGRFTIVPGQGNPDFSFTVQPDRITLAPYESSGLINYTVTSLGGFSGPVSISYETQEEFTVTPGTTYFTVDITPTQPATFSRVVYRHYGGRSDITFQATSGSLTHSAILDIF